MPSSSSSHPSSVRLGAFTGLFALFAGACGAPLQYVPFDTARPEHLAPAPPAVERTVWLSLGENVLPAVGARVRSLVEQGAGRPVHLLPAGTLPDTLPPDALLLAIGDTASTRLLIPSDELAALGSEGFIVRSGSVGKAPLLVADGNPLAPVRFGHGNLGVAFAAYALLEQLGFNFLHPLAPVMPDELAVPESPVDLVESPHWPVRMLHLHTQHPTELTDLLQGFGPGGPDDEAGWAAMLDDWDLTLEWMLANRMNRVQWMVLWAAEWKQFAESATRLARFEALVERAHARGIAVGLDVPLVFRQQHAWRLVRKTGSLADEVAQIRHGVDWFMSAGFDFLSTESGTTEFTHGNPERMLAWLDAFARHLDEVHGAPSYVKVHASSGQVAKGFTDRLTGGPLNFNFLPSHADARLGVMPHTVQHYGLTDPAPTYDNADFGHIRRFLQEEVGRREVLWYPETAYWVSFDVDVPLFLPVYADRRVADLRLLADDETQGRMGRGPHAGGRMQGQALFSSGWEWGYWLNDVVAARAAWTPHVEAESQEEALRRALGPVVAAFGEAGEDVSTWLLDVVEAQRALLIEGRVDGRMPDDLVRRTGQAYLQGFDALDDMTEVGARLSIGMAQMTQPLRLGLVDLRRQRKGTPDYATEIAPLLAEMDETFATLASRADALASRIPVRTRALFEDLRAAMRMTALRARQVAGLYDSVGGPKERRSQRLADARAALDEATEIVREREEHYRLDPDRLAAWRRNPTVYPYQYLWTVRTLYYWWRDEAKAVRAPLSPCFLNIVDPITLALGKGTALDAFGVLGRVTGCAGPPREPRLPLREPVVTSGATGSASKIRTRAFGWADASDLRCHPVLPPCQFRRPRTSR